MKQYIYTATVTIRVAVPAAEVDQDETYLTNDVQDELLYSIEQIPGVLKCNEEVEWLYQEKDDDETP